jgi:excisionase family DNA binding protein
MKRTLLSVKELAHQLGISADSVYRAYPRNEIPAAQINRMIRFNLEKVCQAMEKKARGMPNREDRKQGALAGQGRRRTPQKAPVR